MAVRIPWDKYEASLLLDYCIKVENGEISRTEAISIVSQILRQRAVSAGHEIDEVFRNENGISMQFSAMRNCYLGKSHGLTISKLFYKIVELQKNNPNEFYRLLREESEKMETSTWQEFLQWLRNTHPKREEEILHSLTMINVLGRKNRMIESPLGDIHDPEEINRIMKDVTAPSSHGFQSKKNAVNACYALQLYSKFLQTERIPASYKADQKKQTVEDAENGDGILKVDFNVIQSYAHTKPIYCTYKNQPINLSGWNAIFHALVQLIYRDYKDKFPVGKSLSSSARIDTGKPEQMIYPKEIADGIYLECNVNATGVINKLRSLMDICGMDYDVIEMQYRFTEKGSGKKPIQKAVIVSKWEPQYTEAVTQILTAKYKYGFRIGSAIEMMKIRNYAEAENLDLPASNEDLEKEIKAAGVSIDGKIYIFSKELLEMLGSVIDEIFQTGVTVIFLNAFMEKKEEWLKENHIVSEQILKEVLKQCRPHLYFGQNIITSGNRITEHEAVVAEIHRVAGAQAIVYFTDLTEQLIYIPPEKIAWSLSASDEFVWISEGKYFRMCHFIYNNEDAEEILNFVSEECDSKGYASITGIPMNRISEENYELSTTALYSAVYNAILKGRYYLNGKILSTVQHGVDITVLLKAYCQNCDECSVTEVMKRAEELTGSNNKQYSLIAMYDTMVRADENRFVSETKVSFDVAQIDNLLEQIIGDRFAPVRKISTFALFPICGLNWNHYLLESYCYRFSRKFRLSVLNYNDRNAGIIAAIDLPLSYNEMLCEAAANADIELTIEAVGEYLFTNGFTAKRKYSSMSEIIKRAKTIREER